MARRIDAPHRKRAILAATINTYIKDARPVSSEELSREFEVSSATIRNTLAELEADGYLTHPYTSGGRIPTEKGYRYYVDLLVNQMELIDEEKGQVIGEYKKELRRLDDLLEKTSEVVSVITRYASIVSFLEWENRYCYNGLSWILEQPEFRDVDKMRFLVRMLEDKQKLLYIINKDFPEKVKVYIGHELECPEMESCSLVVSNYRRKNKTVGKVAVLGPTRMQYTHIISALDYVCDQLSDMMESL